MQSPEQHWPGLHVHRPANPDWRPGDRWVVVMDPSGDAFVDCIDCAERYPERVVVIGGECPGWVARPKTARCHHRGQR